jgi:L-threonylcarbamoyladenylate synthase
MKTEILAASAPEAVQRAADVLRRGGLAAFPTDTVYGVGALVSAADAVRRLYEFKGRAAEKALAVLVARPADLALVAAGLTPGAETLARRFWPGPLTLVVPKHPALPEAVSALPTVGVRQPDHPVAQQLLALTGPLAVTSANLSGRPSAVTAEEVLAQLGGRIELLLDGGRTPGGFDRGRLYGRAAGHLARRPDKRRGNCGGAETGGSN